MVGSPTNYRRENHGKHRLSKHFIVVREKVVG